MPDSSGKFKIKEPPPKPDAQGVTRRNKSKPKMTDRQVLDILRNIVTVGDPEYRYTDFNKIGQVSRKSIFVKFSIITSKTLISKNTLKPKSFL